MNALIPLTWYQCRSGDKEVRVTQSCVPEQCIMVTVSGHAPKQEHKCLVKDREFKNDAAQSSQAIAGNYYLVKQYTEHTWTQNAAEENGLIERKVS